VTYFIESLPKFKLKDQNNEALHKFVSNTIRIPEAALSEKPITGKVVIQYLVTKTGDITNIKILRSLRPDLDEEALRVARLIPKYEKPGTQNYKPVDVYMTLPITFMIDKKMINERKRAKK
jgi:TonB family protein